jgi:hypothetical protein
VTEADAIAIVLLIMPEDLSLIDELKEILWDAAEVEDRSRKVEKGLDIFHDPTSVTQSVVTYVLLFVISEFAKRLVKVPLDKAAEEIQKRAAWLFENRNYLSSQEETETIIWSEERLKWLRRTLPESISIFDETTEAAVGDLLMLHGYSVELAVQRARAIIAALRKHLESGDA